jgi:hypothetical protein
MNNNQCDALLIFSLLSYHLHVSDKSAALHKEVECMYVANCTCYIYC